MEIRDDNKMSNDLSTWFQSTGKSMSEALILASTNPKYDKILFIELQVQYMKTIQAQNMLCTKIVLNCQYKNKKTICVHNMF